MCSNQNVTWVWSVYVNGNTCGQVAPLAEGFKDYEQSQSLFFLVRRAKWLERFYAKINVQTVTVERLA